MLIPFIARGDDGEEVQCTMLTVVRPVTPYSDPLFTKDNINRYFPGNLTPTTNASAVASQIESGVGQKITDNILKTDAFKNSSLGRTTNKVEGLSQTSVGLGGQSKISFKFKYVERQAVMTYEGAIKSEVIVAVDQSSFRWVLSKPLSPFTTLALTTVAQQSFSNPSTILSLSHSF
jgi:hypothetical protein